jgi:hypothetical protein
MITLLANENVDLRVVRGLRERGFDVLTMGDLSLANRSTPDAHVLDIATELGRAVLTLNHRDFRRLHEQRGGAHAGIVSFTPDRDHQALAERIADRLKKKTSLAGSFLRITKS